LQRGREIECHDVCCVVRYDPVDVLGADCLRAMIHELANLRLIGRLFILYRHDGLLCSCGACLCVFRAFPPHVRIRLLTPYSRSAGRQIDNAIPSQANSASRRSKNCRSGSCSVSLRARS
jgi:hypothetical protein